MEKRESYPHLGRVGIAGGCGLGYAELPKRSGREEGVGISRDRDAKGLKSAKK